MSTSPSTLTIEPLTRDAFAPFGDVIEAAGAAQSYAINSGTTQRFHDLATIDTTREDGRTIVRLDERRYAYVEIEDAHLRAVSLRWEGETPIVRLDDGSEEPLDCASLRVGPDRAIRTSARRGRLRCRLTTAAQQQLVDHLVDQGGAIALRAGGREWPIADA